MKIKLNTNICPIIIPDTYGSGIQYQNVVDWDDLKELMIKMAEPSIEYALQEIEMDYRTLTMGKFGSPQFYNYITDWIEFELDVEDDLIENIRKTVRNEEEQFFKYAEETFGSHPGFISFFPTEKEKFYNSKDDDYILAMWIMYQLEEKAGMDIRAYQNDYLDEVIEYAEGNGYFEYEEDE